MDKSSVHIDWWDLLSGGFLGDSTSAKLYYDYSFQIEDCNETEITLQCNDWTPRNQVSIRSCYSDFDVSNENYVMPNFQKIAKKHTRFHLLVSSLFPIDVIFFIICFLFNAPSLFIILFAISFLFFGIPSVKEISRFKQFKNQEYINQTLCRYADERRKGNQFVGEDTSKTGKLVGKIIGKMFKFDEEK